MRGDGDDVRREQPELLGSPPRARGRFTRDDGCECVCRFTPACAGTVRSSCAGLSRRAVHPRVRGDGLASDIAMAMDCGSPPRARGRWQAQSPAPQPQRFTPACAGTVFPLRQASATTAVHPRVRGDGAWPRSLQSGTIGSPPRARGRFGVQPGRGHRRRFTPACAGTVWPSRMTSDPRAVHPRVRGDG